MSQARNWCFTVQSDERKGEHVAWLLPGIDAPLRHWLDCPKVDYMVYQCEQAASGKVHLQGYIEFNKPMRLAALKKISGAQAHWEVRRGTEAEAIAYCQKEETRKNGPWEHGNKHGEERARTDLKFIYDCVKVRKTNTEIMEASDGMGAKFEKQIKFLRFVTCEQESDRQAQGVRNIVLYGPTGVGKTFSAINTMCGGKDYYIVEAPSHKDSKLWFDGYEGEKTLILDDFQGDFCSFRFLLRMLDVYKLKIEYKGGFCWAAWTTVIITSNIHPSGWYTCDSNPLKRRLTTRGSEIRLVTEQDLYTVVDWFEAELENGDKFHFDMVHPVVLPTSITIHLPDVLGPPPGHVGDTQDPIINDDE